MKMDGTKEYWIRLSLVIAIYGLMATLFIAYLLLKGD